MRAGLSTVQQTLTPEAAAVLNQSVAEAARRKHGQTTPLHVAATLLSSPAGHLRQACVRSHITTSHPLQCRALELCFSVALDRLAAATPTAAPPISNALMAALKRAQANQRRGCPEQLQQPLLAVKVELEQLILSILDDPSVSRVMREASFSSVAVKAAIEQSLATTSSLSSAGGGGVVGLRGLGLRCPSATSTAQLPGNRSLYMNPRLQQPQQQHLGGGAAGYKRKEDVDKVLEIFLRNKKRNPILVGDSEPESLLNEVLQRIERNEGGETLKNVHVFYLQKEKEEEELSLKLKELGNSIETQLGSGDGGIIIHVGDLEWLVNQEQQRLVTDENRAAVAEIGRLLRRGQVWLIGTAACATYLRCQVYHPSMEIDWDLQAVPITPRAQPHPGSSSPSVQNNGILTTSMESLASSKGSTGASAMSRGEESPRKVMCSSCPNNYREELAKVAVSKETPLAPTSKPSILLPPWLQAAIPSNGTATASPSPLPPSLSRDLSQNREELLQKWKDKCSQLHSHLQVSSIAPAPSILARPKSMRLSTPIQPQVKTGIALGQLKPSPCQLPTLDQKQQDAVRTLDLFADGHKGEFGSSVDADAYKNLFKGLTAVVGWQPEAASTVALTVIQCRSGQGKKRTTGAKADTWLLFMGPDKVGKKRMASALSEHLFGTTPITVSLAGTPNGGSDVSSRGKTAIDRLVEAIRRNPFSVFLLEDVDRADAIVQGSIKWAMEKGRLPDSHGREVSLGSAVFVLTSTSLPGNLKSSVTDSLEEKIEAAAGSRWQFELVVGERVGIKRPLWASNEGLRCNKLRKESIPNLSLDLNLAVGAAEEENERDSRNSSDLTCEFEQEHGRFAVNLRVASLPVDLVNGVDLAIMFKPVDFGALRRKVEDGFAVKFNSLGGSGRRRLEVDEDVLDCVVGTVWFGGEAEAGEVEDRLDGVLAAWSEGGGNGCVVRLAAVKGDLSAAAEEGGRGWRGRGFCW